MNIHSLVDGADAVPARPAILQMTPPASTPRRPVPTTERGADKRDAILVAALELFVERGFHGTAVPEIAERAGVGAGTIYRYFASKEAIVNAVYQRHKAGVFARVMKDFPVDAPARQQFHHMWQAFADFARAEPRAFAFLELHHHADYLDAQSCGIEDGTVKMGLSFIAATQARGELKPLPPMLLIAIVVGAFNGLVRKAYEGHLELTPEVIAQAEQCAWEAIRA